MVEDGFLRLDTEERRRLCEQTSLRTGLPVSMVEKDFWVCWALEQLFGLPGLGEFLTFKGGTSLSKGWRLIERFSEDIDVVLNRAYLGFGEEDPSKNRLRKLRKRCQEAIASELLPALSVRIAEHLDGFGDWAVALASVEDDREQETILFSYPTLGLERAAYIRPSVRIELGARSDVEPAEMPTISSYLSEQFPEAVTPSATAIRTVAPRRTFWEKAMLVHEESFRPPDRVRPSRLSRHYYDLWCLIRRGIAADAVRDDSLFDRVASRREVFWGQSWVNYESLRRGSLRLAPSSDLEGWRRDYRDMSEMLFGEVPTFDEILVEVQAFEDAFNRSEPG